MASKKEEMAAFNKLRKAFPDQYCTLDLEMHQYSCQKESEIKYHAYAAPIGKVSYVGKPSLSPLGAVNDVLRHYGVLEEQDETN